MSFSKKTALLLSVIAAGVMFASCAFAADTLTLRMGNQHPSEALAYEMDQIIVDRVAKETDGRIKIELYSDNALGDATNIFDELMVGTIDMAHISPNETYDSRVSATMLPYLAFDYDTLVKAYAPGSFIHDEVYEALDKLGIHLGGIFCEGFNGIGAMEDLTDPGEPGKDKGIIIRSPMMDVYSLCFEDLGFRVSSMPYSDTYTAMQTGVVKGFGGLGTQMNFLAFGDIIKHFYDYRYIQEATMIMISNATWAKISAEDQAIITKIINEVCAESAKRAGDIADEYAKRFPEKNIKYTEFTKEQLASFQASTRANVWPKLAKNYPDGWLKKVEESLK